MMMILPVFILLADSVRDVKKREIYPLFTLVGLAEGILCRAFLDRMPAMDILLSLVPGMVMLIAAVFSSGQVGRGDALAVFFTGIWSGPWDVWGIFFAAVFLAAAFAGGLWIRKRKNAEIPFVPFLALGFIGYLFWR